MKNQLKREVMMGNLTTVILILLLVSCGGKEETSGLSNDIKYDFNDSVKNLKYNSSGMEDYECENIVFHISHESKKDLLNYDVVVLLNGIAVYKGKWSPSITLKSYFKRYSKASKFTHVSFWIIDKKTSIFQIWSNKDVYNVNLYKDVYIELFYEMKNDNDFAIKLKNKR